MKSVNIVCSHYYPENTAGANRIEAIASVLATENKVTVFSLTEKGSTATDKDWKVSPNLSVEYLNLPNYPANNFIVRMMFESLYSYRLILKSKKTQSDINIVSIPFLGLLFTSRLLLKKPIIDIRDLVWEYVPSNGFFSRLISKILFSLTRVCLKNSKYIVVTSNFAKNTLQKIIDNKKIKVLENGISKNRYNITSNIKLVSKDNPFTISYVGNIGTAQNLLTFANVAAKLPGVKFKIIGGGNREQELLDHIEKYEIKNIELLGKLEWSELVAHYSKSSIIYAQLSPEFSSAIPSKLYEYLAVGVPIIYGGEGAVEEFAEKFDNFFIIAPNNEEALIEIITKIKKNYPTITSNNKVLLKRNYIRESISKEYQLLIK